MKTLESLDKFGFVEQRATGSSMMPFIKSGDKILIVKKIRRLTKGEIGLFLLEDTLVLHRVKKVEKDGYLFSGDNRYRSDGFIQESQVVGRLIAIYKKSKKIECESKSFRRQSLLFNFWLFKPFLVFSMRLISRIKSIGKKK